MQLGVSCLFSSTFLLSAETCQLGHTRISLVVIFYFASVPVGLITLLSLSLSVVGLITRLSLCCFVYIFFIIRVSGECVVKNKCWFSLFTCVQGC